MLHCHHCASMAAPNCFWAPMLLGESKITLLVLLHYGEWVCDLEASEGAFVDRWPLTLAERFRDLTNMGIEIQNLETEKKIKLKLNSDPDHLPAPRQDDPQSGREVSVGRKERCKVGRV